MMQHSVSNYSADMTDPKGSINLKQATDIDLADIVRAVQADIAHIKTQLNEIAPFPKGK